MNRKTNNRPTSRSTGAADHPFSVFKGFWRRPSYLGRWAKETRHPASRNPRSRGGIRAAKNRPSSAAFIRKNLMSLTPTAILRSAPLFGVLFLIGCGSTGGAPSKPAMEQMTADNSDREALLQRQLELERDKARLEKQALEQQLEVERLRAEMAQQKQAALPSSANQPQASQQTVCTQCRGTGRVYQEVKCGVCNGKGDVKCRTCDGKGEYYNTIFSKEPRKCKDCKTTGIVRCSSGYPYYGCNGTGVNPNTQWGCPMCSGTGYVK